MARNGPVISLPWPPRVQIAGVSSLEEAVFCKEVRVDAVGFTLELPSGTHDGITNDKARDIIARMPRQVLAVLITYISTGDAAAHLARFIDVDAAQFHGGIAEDELASFHRLCPNVKTIGRVTVAGPSSIEIAERFAPPLWDAIILDSFDPSTGSIGATGLTHDWSISAEIVRRAKVPVVLAGGLTPENVAEAIRQVHPCGVDAHSGVEGRDGARNFDKIRNFAQAALKGFAGLANRSTTSKAHRT